MSGLKGSPAVHNESIVDEALRAMIDGLPRRASIKDGSQIEGRVWEIYRSIGTPSLRIRISDAEGRVHHYNSMLIDSLTLERKENP